MIVDISGNLRPAIGTAEHWRMFEALRNEPALFADLQQAVEQAVTRQLTNGPAVIDSRQEGSEALRTIRPGWHGRFNRQFRNMPSYAKGSLWGMMLWHRLSIRPDYWAFVPQTDPHGEGWHANRYWKLANDHPLVPDQPEEVQFDANP